ncbi:MAG: hypothetical protein RL143_1403 [Pseudomonadota bacterium]
MSISKMDELELEFSLAPQLQADTHKLGDFPLCTLLLMNDVHYPWFILVPRRAGVTEIYHLSEADQVQLLRESSALAETASDLFAAKKMNIANLGNMVSQLHVHVIVRLVPFGVRFRQSHTAIHSLPKLNSAWMGC